MTWLPIVSLVLGAVLAHRYKIIILLPAMLVVTFVAIGAEALNSASSAILTIVAAGVALQIGYFAGILIQLSLRVVFPPPLSPFSQTRSSPDSLS